MTRTHAAALRAAELARGLAAAIALLTFVLGVPAALLALAPVYLPATGLSWDHAWRKIMAPDDGSLLLLVLAGVAWLCWAAFALSVMVELIAGVRRLNTPAIPLLGAFQRSAASLVATAGVLLAVTSSVAMAAPPAAATTLTTTQAPRLATPPATTNGARAATTPPTATRQPSAVAAPAQELPTITVARGDTLWDLAERHLGTGTRYAEIRDLNADRTQPDGRTLANADWILPGWTLVLPADAHDLPPAMTTAAAAGNESDTVVVQPGDTLSAIAQRKLGAASRYTEIVTLNANRTQTDGSRLTNPDVIRPGWTLALPPRAAPNRLMPTATEPSLPPAEASPVPQSAASNPTRLPEYDIPAPTPEASATQSPAAALPLPLGAPEAETRHADWRAWYLGFTALAATGVAGELARRRKLQQRARRIGETIPLPSPGSPAAAAERSLRRASPPVSITALTTTLANLGCRRFNAGRELPRIGVLLLNERSLTLRLIDDAPDAVPPFTAADARTWTANTADIAAEQPIDDSEQCVPYPLLVTLGHTEDATLIANLEAAGTLAITGDDAAADAVLRALVLETATSELANQTPVRVDGTLAALATAFESVRLRPADERDDAVALEAEIAAVLTSHGLDDTLQSRGDRTLEDTWQPVVRVGHSLQRPPSRPWSGVVTITRDGTAGGWTLRTMDDGTARLEPLGVDFQPQRLSAEQLEDLTSVLVTALPPEPRPALADARMHMEDDIRALKPAQPITEDAAAAAIVSINLLGPIEITGLPASAGQLTARMTELLAYVALHGPATGADLDEVLWGGERVRPGTRAQLLFRTRERVGKSVLPTLQEDGKLRLGPAATTDWALFQRLLRESALGRGEDRVQLLSEALRLVRDRPFRGIGSGDYAWADSDIQQMTSTVADAAIVLARLLHGAARHQEALNAAFKGLSVDPLSDSLQQVAIAATSEVAGQDEADALRHRFAARMSWLGAELG